MRVEERVIEVNNIMDWLTVLSFIIFVTVSWMTWTSFSPFIEFEEKIASFFEKLFGYPEMTYSNGFFNGLQTFLVTYGSAPYLSMLTVFFAFILFIKGEVSLAIAFLGIMSSGGIFGYFLKNLFKRPRPSNSLASENGYSFPSGHAIASSLFFLSILFLLLPLLELSLLRILLTILVLVLWFTLLFSRLYFHAHHLGDLLVGVSYAIFWARSGIFIYRWILTNWVTISS